MKKLFLLAAVGIITITQVYSNEISFSGIFDTYAGKPSGGVSLEFSGNIFENFVQTATIKYEYNNSYTTTMASIYTGAFWSAGGGFAMVLNTNSVYPGLYAEIGLNTKTFFLMKVGFILGLSAENILKPILYDVKLTTRINFPNAKTLIAIVYRDELQGATKVFGDFEVIAYAANFPLQIAINSNVEFILSSAYQNGFELALDVGVALHFVTKDATSYFAGFTVQAISLNTNNTPFSINVGTKFSW